MTGSPVEPSLAATVVLVRSGRRGPEVLLTRRPASMAFAPDMEVFPGGRVDADDAARSWAGRSVVTPVQAVAALGGDLDPVTALAVHVAAVRELFEEAGVLLADLPDDGATRRALGSARSALVGGAARFSTTAAELGLRLRTDLLVPLSRWVTPPNLPRRFDARFFAAELPAGVRVSFEGDEVAGHAWHTPADALDAMAEGRIAMWLPTSATLQQLEHAGSVGEMRARLVPGRLGSIEVEELTPAITRILMPAAGGVAGQPVYAYLVGRRRHVLVDPGDPTGPALERAQAVAASRGGSIEALALTQVDPDHAAGAEALREALGVPVLGGRSGGRRLPYPLEELADLTDLAELPGPAGPGVTDVPMLAVHTPGTSAAHVAFVVTEAPGVVSVLCGDLAGPRGARSIVERTDTALLAESRARVERLAPDAPWLPGHPGAELDAAGADPEAPQHG
jgi:glyoxylase-like metal-dependent hydrolase (beta-lactamase superfamily II)/8-oxo-dGTP pyrophosphatase MutT (NUDIX family)